MSRKYTSKLLSFTQSSGVELNINLVLDKQPNRQEQKLKTLTQYVQKYPSGWKKRLELANLLYAIGQWEQGVKEYHQVLKQKPELIEVRLKLGKILQLMGKKNEAVEIYKSTLSLINTSTTQNNLKSTHQHILGLIAASENDTQRSILAFESATNLESSNASHWLALGQVRMEKGDMVGALQAFDTVLSLRQDDLVALLASYDMLLTLGNLPEAERRLSKAEELAAGDFQVLKRLAHRRCVRRLVTGKEGKRTKKLITAALKLAPNAPEVHDLLAYYYIFRGDWKKGVEVLQEFTQSQPNNLNGLYYYGRCLFQTGKYHKALEVMLLAHRLYPNDCEIYRGLCEILHYTKDFSMNKGSEISLSSFVEEMLEKFPQSWSICIAAGRVLIESLGQVEQGFQVSERGIQLEPHLPNAWFCHGRVLMQVLKYDEAVKTLEKGWDLLNSQEKGKQISESKEQKKIGYIRLLSVAVLLGESYRALEDDVMSRDWSEKAVNLANDLRYFDPVMANYWQGRALESLGNLAGAMEIYRTALNGQLLFPNREEVKAKLKCLKTK